MKKILLLCYFGLFLSSGLYAQLIFDHGPLVNFPGAGTGGADVSALHNNLNSFGFRVSLNATTNFRIADSFTIPPFQAWAIDSIIIYSYQTSSGNISTTTSVSCALYNGAPNSGGALIGGDLTTNVLNGTYWSGIYRTDGTTFTNVDRPIMKNRIVPTGTWTLNTGTYWLSWQVAGTAVSGPWCPPITFPSQTITGSALQHTGTAWATIIDTSAAGTGDDAAQGMPFLIYGQVFTGVQDVEIESTVSIYPNPFRSTATIEISSASATKLTNSGFTFSVFDVTGRQVREMESKKLKFEFDRDGLASGLYTYKLVWDHQILKSGTFMVE